MTSKLKLTSLVKTARFLIVFSFIISALSYPLNTVAQKNIIHQSQLWYAYFNNLKFSDKYRLLTDLQERQFIEPVGAQGNFIIRTIFYRNLGSNWEVGAGSALFFTSPQKIPASSSTVVPEIRPTVDFVNKQKVGDLNLGHRYRFEARYYHQVVADKLGEGYNFGNFRFRYQFSADYPIIKNVQKKPVLSIKVYDEVMVNFGKKIVSNAFDQNRIYGGIVYDINKSFSVDLGYLNWFQETSDGKSYYKRNIIRLGINHRINLSKSSAAKKG